MRNVTLLLLLSLVVALPTCSMMGNQGGGEAQYTLPQPPGMSPATIQAGADPVAAERRL
jgi:hypothetical protein